MKKALAITLAAMMLLTTAFAADDVLIFDDVDAQNTTLDGEILDSDILVVGEEGGLEFSFPEVTRIPHAHMYGKIIDTTESGSILVQNNMNEEDRVVLHISEETLVLDAETGAITTLDERTTEFVNVYYGPATTRSLPPQSTAAAIIVNVEEDQFKPFYSIVDFVEATEDRVRLLVDGGGLYAGISEETELSHVDGREIAISDIVAGDELLLWYDIVALSYPGQTFAQKAVVVRNAPQAEIMPFDTNTLTLSLSAGVASVGGVEVDLVGVNYTDDGQATFPLRQICEAFGYEVHWFEGTDFAEISKDENKVAIEFDNAVIGVNGIEIELDYAPEVFGGVTYVTADFFELALGVTVVVITAEV